MRASLDSNAITRLRAHTPRAVRHCTRVPRVACGPLPAQPRLPRRWGGCAKGGPESGQFRVTALCVIRPQARLWHHLLSLSFTCYHLASHVIRPQARLWHHQPHLHAAMDQGGF
jgi:hypothetical protein